VKTYVKIYQIEDGRSVKSRHVTLQNVAPDQVVAVLRAQYSTGRPPGAGDPAEAVTAARLKEAKKKAS